jgi:V/A-type H+-transporting ATPase subunit I
VFAREDLVPALWLHPLHEPVTLLLAAVGMGAAILLGGLLLNALQAHWRRAAPLWWARDAGLVLAYVSLLAGLAWPPLRGDLLALVLAGAVWFVLGSMLIAPAHRLAALGAGLAQFVEQALQLLVNTVSFARVGAFALAHAGLSAAVTGVAEALGGAGDWIVLLLGNLLILALEGLVVGIQTTRLLLFEFFVRFLKGTGRVFRPLPPPLAHPLPTTGTHNA